LDSGHLIECKFLVLFENVESVYLIF